MAKTLVVHGHGKWTPDDLYAWVPKNMTLELYTEGAKNLKTGFAWSYLTGDFENLPGGNPTIVEPFRSVQNYSLSQLTTNQYNTAKKYWDNGALKPNSDYSSIILRPGSKPYKLSTLLNFAEKKKYTKVVWLACRAIGLTKTGGKELGFNTAQESRFVTRQQLDDHEINGELIKIENGWD